MRSRFTGLLARSLLALCAIFVAPSVTDASPTHLHPSTARTSIIADHATTAREAPPVATTPIPTTFSESLLYAESAGLRRQQSDTIPVQAAEMTTVATVDFGLPAGPYREPSRSELDTVPVAAEARPAGWLSVLATLMLVAFFLFRRTI